MNVYFADRQMNVLGSASTGLPSGLVVSEDKRTEDVETGVAVFECKVRFDESTRAKVESLTAVGNYVLRSHGKENEFYTIIETECDTKKQCVYIYAEDAGLDLLNEVVGEYEATEAKTINHYIETFAYDSGFVVGTNEAAGLTRQLSFDDEETVTARLAKVADAFGCEISYSYKIKGLYIKNKYINIHEKRGQDIGITLRLNKDIDSIVTTKSIANLATALRCTGGTPEDAEDPITLRGYSYDDGDFYIDGDTLKSRTALNTWSRYMWADEPNTQAGHEGHIVKLFSHDTTSQKELLEEAIAELKLAREMELNFEVEIPKLPDNVRIGDRVNIVDELGELYLSTRILQLEVSVADQDQKATLGEHLIKSSGIHESVKTLAARFSKVAHSAARALMIANIAKAAAAEAQAKANEAASEAAKAQTKADAATEAANTATQSAANAQEKADNAQAAVDSVEENVASLEKTIADAQAAAEQAQKAAETAETKAVEAQQSAVIAQTKADETAESLVETQEKAETAIEKAETAISTADQAKAEAVEAATTAAAALLDAEQAQKEIDTLGENLTTLENTMSVEYARKTDLTEAEASLQTQISQNAAEIKSTATAVQEIDETANNAAEMAEQAQNTAALAQAQADQATADAEAAQTAATEAATAAAAAQSEADTAREAANTAKSVADKAEADLEAAKADLATVSGRVDATEEEIVAAQKAVEVAQTAADKAKADAESATKKAAEAQAQADTAVSKADTAQQAADEAGTKAANAQQLAEQAQGNATAAIAAANEAATAAATAQETANTAKANAEDAQAKADAAAQAAADAKTAANDADARAAQAEVDLATAQKNLAEVVSRVDATEEEVAAAQADVVAAQEAADKAQAEAEAAQTAADAAKADAVAAQERADEAKTAADNAQTAAEEAQAAADAAQEAVDALAIRVTKTETDIVQTNSKIELLATKKEVTETLGGYYTKEETDAAIVVKADEINLSVDSKIEEIEIGNRNYLLNTSGNIAKTYTFSGWQQYVQSDFPVSDDILHRLTDGQNVTLSVYIENTTDYAVGVMFMVYTPDDSNGYRQYISTAEDDGCIEPGESGYVHFTCMLNVNTVTSVAVALRHREITGTSTVNVHSWKLELGNKATDWTPAPEDVDGKIIEQGTSIRADTESIVLAVRDSSVQNTEYEEYQETMDARLEALADQIVMKFNSSRDAINELDTDVQAKFAEIYKHITFDLNGITIGAGENAIMLNLDNDQVVFFRGGVELVRLDTNDFTPRNITMKKVGSRLTLGNFAWEVQEDGTPIFLKVGG